MIATSQWIIAGARRASHGSCRNVSTGRRSLSNVSTKATPVDPPPTPSSKVASSNTSKITWMRGYLGAHSNTDPPDAKFLGVAAIVTGAGFYAWFVEPPTPK